MIACPGPNHARGVLLITKACKACDIGCATQKQGDLICVCLGNGLMLRPWGPLMKYNSRAAPLLVPIGAPLQWPKWFWWVYLPLEGIQVPKLAKS